MLAIFLFFFFKLMRAWKFQMVDQFLIHFYSLRVSPLLFNQNTFEKCTNTMYLYVLHLLYLVLATDLINDTLCCWYSLHINIKWELINFFFFKFLSFKVKERKGIYWVYHCWANVLQSCIYTCQTYMYIEYSLVFSLVRSANLI